MKPWNNPAAFWIAEYKTPRFHFHAYGSTRDEAYLALREALENHRQQYDLSIDWASDWETRGYTFPVELGQGYRDATVISHLHGEIA